MSIKEEVINNLTDGLTDKDLDRMISTIQLKIDNGQTYDEIYSSFVSSIYATIELTTPGLTEDELLDMTTEISHKLVDRLMLRMDIKDMPNDVPPGLIN